MKQYPRIYSLSTVGLIHHREFDYRFHPFPHRFHWRKWVWKKYDCRSNTTYFCGLRSVRICNEKLLVIVTHKAWSYSPKRLGKGIGYAFLNIETQPGKYLVVGSYMEAGNRSTQSFIIQQGFDWPNIKHLEVLVSLQDF